MSKFKVGDKVKCIRVEGTKLELGCMETVTQVGHDWLELKGIGGVYFMDRFELVSRPHKHAELIKAWADGAEIQELFDGTWRNTFYPRWHDTTGYFRIKPTSKPDRVEIRELTYDTRYQHLEADVSDTPNVKFTFDGDTGKLKAVEILA